MDSLGPLLTLARLYDRYRTEKYGINTRLPLRFLLNTHTASLNPAPIDQLAQLSVLNPALTNPSWGRAGGCTGQGQWIFLGPLVSQTYAPPIRCQVVALWLSLLRRISLQASRGHMDTKLEEKTFPG